jgi:hypothetical protein
MGKSTKLYLIKLIHTLVWLFFNLVLVYLFYAAMTGQVDIKFWVGIGLISLECIILIFNRWTCPLSPMARKYTASTADNFDIFLPNWLAKYNIPIYSTLFVILMLILFF